VFGLRRDEGTPPGNGTVCTPRERDDAEALHCFAQIFRFALSVNRNLGKAADAAHVRLLCHYGNLLEEGRGAPQAIQYFRPAADHLAGGHVFDPTLPRPEPPRPLPRGDMAAV
jgi:hydrogenase maturation factor HypF (carbamoyltransferase family)